MREHVGCIGGAGLREGRVGVVPDALVGIAHRKRAKVADQGRFVVRVLEAVRLARGADAAGIPAHDVEGPAHGGGELAVPFGELHAAGAARSAGIEEEGADRLAAPAGIRRRASAMVGPFSAR